MNTNSTSAQDNRVAVDSIIESLNNRCGRTIATIGKAPSKFQVLPTGIAQLDKVLTVTGSKDRGIPKGDVTQIWGPQATGKTSLALSMAAQAQKLHPDKYVAFLDVGQSFNEKEALDIGVDMERLTLFQPLSGEEVSQICQRVLEAPMSDVQPFVMLVIDGFGAIPNLNRKTKSDTLASVIRELQVLAKSSGTSCVITRRQNPNRGAPAAADALIKKISKTIMELVKETEGVITVKLHKNIPGGHLTIDPPEVISIPVKDLKKLKKR